MRVLRDLYINHMVNKVAPITVAKQPMESEMPKFIFAYHGGGQPESAEEGEKVMAAWGAWIEKHAEALGDGGSPVGMSKTVSASGVADDGGSNPLSGFSLCTAASMDDAIEIAKGCPILDWGGTVEIAERMEM